MSGQPDLGYTTHDVLNQPGALEDYDAFTQDVALSDAARVFGADWAGNQLQAAGRLVGSARVQHLARQANRHLPELRTHDRCRPPDRHRRVPSRLS